MASFADYVKDLMGVLPKVNGNPMLSVTSMTDDNARYREDPFYKSRDIQARDQLALDEAERKRLAAQAGSGMMASGQSSDRSPELTKEQTQFFDWMETTPEGQAFKDQRGGAISNLIGMVAPGAGLFNTGKAALNGMPDFSSLYQTPQSFYDWQAGQQQSDPKYIADSIARIEAESARRAEQEFLANSGGGSGYDPSGGFNLGSNYAGASLDAANRADTALTGYTE